MVLENSFGNTVEVTDPQDIQNLQGLIEAGDDKAIDAYLAEMLQRQEIEKFSHGEEWELLTDLVGASHEEGGIDISVGADGVKIAGDGEDYYAEDGLVVKGGYNPDTTVNVGGRTISTASPEYREIYENGRLMRYDKDNDVYNASPLRAVEVVGEAPQWIKDRDSKEKHKVHWWNTLNYKKWGLEDYSDYSSFNTAFRNARVSGAEEFVYKGNRYNTKLIEQEQSDLYWESKKFLEDYFKNNNYKPTESLTLLDSLVVEMENKEEKFIEEKYGRTIKELYEEQSALKKEYDELDDKIIDGLTEQEYKRYNELTDILHLGNNTEFYESGSVYLGKEDEALYKEYIESKYQERYDEINSKSEIDRLNDRSYYFSITDSKPHDMEEDGYLDRKEKKIFFNSNTESDKLNTTYVHELTHKAQDKDVYKRTPRVDVTLINQKIKEGLDYDIKSARDFDYFSNPSEIEARKMSLLFYGYKNNIDFSKMTEEEFDKFYESSSNDLPYDIKHLFELFKFQRGDLLKYINNDYR